MGKYLSRQEILDADDLVTEEVPVPEWGGMVLVKSLSAGERDKWEATFVRMKSGKDPDINLENLRAKLVAVSVVDEDLTPIFTDADIAGLAKKSAAAMQRVFNVASRLSGVSEADQQSLAKN